MFAFKRLSNRTQRPLQIKRNKLTINTLFKLMEKESSHYEVILDIKELDYLSLSVHDLSENSYFPPSAYLALEFKKEDGTKHNVTYNGKTIEEVITKAKQDLKTSEKE
jgi:hypothetical protein